VRPQLCDDRVVTMMPKLCGKAFFEKRKLPVAVRVSRGSAAGAAAAVARAVASAHAILGAGQAASVRVAKSDFSAEQVADNVMFVAGRLVALLPRRWKGVM